MNDHRLPDPVRQPRSDSESDSIPDPIPDSESDSIPSFNTIAIFPPTLQHQTILSDTPVLFDDSDSIPDSIPDSDSVLVPSLDSSLGIYTGIASTVSYSRKLRYYLQSLVRELLPDQRVGKCLRFIRPGAEGVTVMYSVARNRAWYKGTILCGWVWFCPVCAARITEERRRELTRALAAARGKYRMVLVTYTMRHELADPLSKLLVGLLDAFRAMKSGREWQWIKSDFLLVGSVRSLETTDGENGYHVHLHELMFIDASLEDGYLAGLEASIKRRWLAVLGKRGFDASWERGVYLETANDRVLEYVAKYGHDPIEGGWNIEHELTKGPAKLGRLKGRTPFQLVADYGDGDQRAGLRFQEFFREMKGHKQLVWSRGMRDLLGLGAEQTDAALAALPVDESAIEAGNIAPEQWRLVLVMDIRAEFLHVVEQAGGDWSVAWSWLAALGVPEVIRVNATDLMWSEYEKQYGSRR